jgi:hypothetical protein
VPEGALHSLEHAGAVSADPDRQHRDPDDAAHLGAAAGALNGMRIVPARFTVATDINYPPPPDVVAGRRPACRRTAAP